MSDDTDADPLADADIGTTATVESTADLWLGDLADDATRGSDRYATHEIADVTVRTDEYGDRVAEVTVRSDVTKRLPWRWDREPHTHATPTEPSRWRQLGGLLLGAGLAGTVAVALTHRMMGALAGETVTFAENTPTLLDLAPAVVVIGLLTLLIGAMMPYLPGGMGGAWR